MKLLLTDTETFFNSLKQSSAGLNPSLLLYKYSEPDLKDKKGDFLKLVCEHHNKNTVLMAEKVQQNMDAVFETIPSERKKFFRLTTISNLAVNLSQNCIVENSAVSFYQPYGFAYLPASGIKGMARAYAVNKGYNDAFIKQIFGDDDKDGSKFAGSITFYDAIPVKADLHTDISNCHHTEYYKGKANPIDNEGALPSLFLALKSGSEFNFAISLRSGLKDDPQKFKLLAQTEQILKEALFTNGIGAKTSLGYGIFDDKNFQTQQEIINSLSSEINPNKKSEKQTLLTSITLESPAFLSGSDLTEFEKPALRSATLRGLLRWWWRRIYFNNPQAIEELAKKIGKDTINNLSELERNIWGGIIQGASDDKNDKAIFSPVRIKITTDKETQIPNNSNPKYSTYGTNGEGKKPKRKFIDASSCWQVKFTVKNQVIKDELQKALYLLQTYGGVGAKCRKGFGSLKITLPDFESFIKATPSNMDFFTIEDFADSSQQALVKISDEIMKQISIKFRQPGNPPKSSKAGNQKKFGYSTNKERYASPVHYSLHKQNDKYSLTVAVFYAPQNNNSNQEEMTFAFKDTAIKALKETAELAKNNKISTPVSHKPVSRSVNSGVLKPGDVCNAVVLEKTTKKGGKIVKDLATKEEGPLQNGDSVSVNQTVQVIVASGRKSGEYQFRLKK